MEKVPTKSNLRDTELDSQLIQKKNGISQKVFRSIKAVLSKPGDIYKLFFLFTKKLNKFFPISRSALIVYSEKEDNLKVIAMKSEKGARKGLALTLPKKDSLLYKIFADGHICIQHHPEKLGGNFIEEKILKNETAKSLAILPISQDCTRCGLVCLSSSYSDAFVSLENGTIDEVLDNFSKNLMKRMPPTNI